MQAGDHGARGVPFRQADERAKEAYMTLLALITRLYALNGHAAAAAHMPARERHR